jgi:hypothetical protein
MRACRIYAYADVNIYSLEGEGEVVDGIRPGRNWKLSSKVAEGMEGTNQGYSLT